MQDYKTIPQMLRNAVNNHPEKNIAIVTSSGINFEPIVQVKQFRFKNSKKNKGKEKLIRSTNFER